jgi:predicted metal-dependent HD superfamily phosphohydrolase
MVAFLAIAFASLHKNDKSKELLDELMKRSEDNERGVNINIVYIFSAVGDFTSAQFWLAKANQTNDVGLIWWQVDPLFNNVRIHLQQQNQAASPNFAAAENYITEMLGKDMPKLPYHNYDHIKDVLSASLIIGEHEQLNADQLKILRLAALLHDAGFIESAKDPAHPAGGHESIGAEMARHLLPAYGITPDQIEIISKMILATRLPQSPSTQLEKILCDADLDYLGRDDFYEIGGRLLQEMKANGIVETEREWNIMQKTFLESHKFHTEFSKTNRETFKQVRLQEIIAKLKNRS